jgi:hypothetical protein
MTRVDTGWENMYNVAEEYAKLVIHDNEDESKIVVEKPNGGE